MARSNTANSVGMPTKDWQTSPWLVMAMDGTPCRFIRVISNRAGRVRVDFSWAGGLSAPAMSCRVSRACLVGLGDGMLKVSGTSRLTVVNNAQMTCLQCDSGVHDGQVQE